MTIVFAVVGQHRAEPGRLLLLGDDGRYYAYDAAGRLAFAQPSAAWVLDAGARPAAGATPGRPDHRPSRRFPRWSFAPRGGGTAARRPLAALAAALAILLGAVIGGPVALAHAPALATAAVDVSLHAAPSEEAAVLAVVPAGSEMELTGAAEGAYLEVAADGRLGWAGADLLDDGIVTATLAVAFDLRAAPSADGEIVAAVPAGGTVILTGAAVDGFLAASFAGSGGWLPAAAVA